ncbi:MAG TPA: RagB/SusD family nutrient uptake outer membrane protein [Balneolaceae bacterium]|nr:RagB/SusD family nutrient uptake outer membrane protein [Balneolaceae bacterium]
METFRNQKSLSLIAIGFLIVLFLAGCKNSLLHQTPRGQQTVQNFWRNKSDATRATNATYASTKGFNILAFNFLGMTDIASDDANKGSTQGDASYMTRIHNFTFNASNPAFIGVWNSVYKGIFRANEAIKNIPKIKNMNPQLRQRLIAENKFLRAYFYFFLVRAFGGVPLVQKPLKPGHFHKKRASIDSTYAFIVHDLKDAAKNLPAQYEGADVGRATKGAANAYLAKVYLFMHNYKQAENYAQKVITSDQYSLLSSYGKIFTKQGENSSGTIFSIQAKAVANRTGGTMYSVTQGVRGTPNYGWGFNMPSHNLVKAYAPGDPRMESTILFDYEETPDGLTVRDNPNIKRYYKGRERYNQKSFTSINTPGGTSNSGVNVRKMRYADVLLIAAEAAYHNGNTARAQKYLNMVRKRARSGQTATLGLQVEPLSSFLADTLAAGTAQPQQFAKTIKGKPFIRFVQDGGPAASTKLENFDWKLYQSQSPLIVKHIDVIHSVNGKPVSTSKAYRNQLKSLSPGQLVTLSIERVMQSNNGSNVSTSTQTFQVNMKTQKLLPDVTATGQQLLHDIWHERRVELGMEQHRFFNLRREGRAQQVLQALGRNYTKKDSVYPIPQQEIELGNVKQNPGFGQ